MDKVIKTISEQTTIAERQVVAEIGRAAETVIPLTYWEEDDSYLPSEFSRIELPGRTAELVRAAFGITDGSDPVILEESVRHVGYSEYTDEVDHSFTVICGDYRKDFINSYRIKDAPLIRFARWVESKGEVDG